MNRWNIAIAISGFDAIGKAVSALARERQTRYAQRYGADVRLVGVCGSRAGAIDHAGLSPERAGNMATWDAGLTGDSCMERVQAHVLVEAGPTDYETGGAGYRYICAVLIGGMHVVAVSKGALVFDYVGLSSLALKHGVQLKVSGATSAALPTIDLLQYNLAGCRVLEVEGILSATTNFVLSRMVLGDTFDKALAEAQRLEIAEPNPRFDVEGRDTACGSCSWRMRLLAPGYRWMTLPETASSASHQHSSLRGGGSNCQREKRRACIG